MSLFTCENIARVTAGRWLHRPDGDGMTHALDGVGIDTRSDLMNRAFLAIRGEQHDGHAFLDEAIKGGARLLLVENEPQRQTSRPSVGILQVEDTRRALAQLARAYRRTFTITKIIAVTGSAGKTTTKRLLHAVLSQSMPGSAAPHSFNNEIGVPLTLLAASTRDRFVIVEVGTNAPGEIHDLGGIAEPDMVVITNIGRSHLEKLGSVEGVAKEKVALLSHLREHGVAILNADAPLLRPYVGLASSSLLFGESDDGDFRLTGYGAVGGRLSAVGNARESGKPAQQGMCDRWWFEVNGRATFSLRLPGKHNALNALAVVAVARRLGLDDATIQRGFDAVEPDAMRAVWRRIGGFTVFNDAYNANPDSVAASLETFADLAADAPRRIVVLGDMLELGADGPALHEAVAKQLIALDVRARIDHICLIGTLTGVMAEPLRKAWGRDRVLHADALNDQTKQSILDRLQPDDAIMIKGSRGVALERLVDTLAATDEHQSPNTSPTANC